MPTHLKVDADVEPLLDIFQKVAIGFGAARNVDLEMTVPRTTLRQSHQLSENEKSEETDILVEQHFSELVWFVATVFFSCSDLDKILAETQKNKPTSVFLSKSERNLFSDGSEISEKVKKKKIQVKFFLREKQLQKCDISP